MAGALAFVVALTYLILHKGLGRMLKSARSGKLIQIKERVPLDQKNALYVVEIANKTLLLGAGEKGISPICDLTSSSDLQKSVPFPSLKGASHDDILENQASQ